MNLKSVKNQKEELVLNEDGKNKKRSDTTAIRISSELYELLREKAFYERSTIRQVADDILELALKK
ncbi:hypothetical protein AAK882_03490 [Carnobacteriaceae bacterium 52-44]|jgi:hypothetical protein